jgi:plastocyanin
VRSAAWLLLLALPPGARPLAGQSVVERSPNMHGTWTLAPRAAAFVFAHRFEFLDGGDELRNIPTLTLALGLPAGLTIGLDYTSNSEVVQGRTGGNETQYWFKRGLEIREGTTVAGLLAYNTAAASVDGALGVRHRLRRLSLLGEVRAFSDRFGRGDPGMAAAVGAAVHLTDHLALTGDVGRVLAEDSIPSTWSAALAMAIPGSPHTFSLQATDGGALTLQGTSRRTPLAFRDVRYGFTFTVPLGSRSQWARIFRAAPATPAPAPDAGTARVEIRMVAYAPREIRIRAGESVEWVNRDPIEHTVTADDGGWGSEMMKEGEAYVRRFDRPGRYPYHCLPHPQMTGVVVVEGG